jgi:hypothetical protein
MIVEVIKFVLQPEKHLIIRHNIRHNLLYRAWTERRRIHVLYIYEI